MSRARELIVKLCEEEEVPTPKQAGEILGHVEKVSGSMSSLSRFMKMNKDLPKRDKKALERFSKSLDKLLDKLDGEIDLSGLDRISRGK